MRGWDSCRSPQWCRVGLGWLGVVGALYAALVDCWYCCVSTALQARIMASGSMRSIYQCVCKFYCIIFSPLTLITSRQIIIIQTITMSFSSFVMGLNWMKGFINIREREYGLFLVSISLVWLLCHYPLLINVTLSIALYLDWIKWGRWIKYTTIIIIARWK